jgi:inositol transport system permease protein
MTATTSPALDRNLLHRLGIVAVLFVIAGLLSVLTDSFATASNLTNVARQVSINGILAVGVTFVLLTGGVDLSLGSVVALSGVACALFAHPGEYPLFVPICVGLLTGGLCGLLNGVLVTRGGIAPFIVTLGMMTVARGLALIFSGGKPVADMSPDLTGLAGDLGPVPIPLICFAAVAVLSPSRPTPLRGRRQRASGTGGGRLGPQGKTLCLWPLRSPHGPGGGRPGRPHHHRPAQRGPSL